MHDLKSPAVWLYAGLAALVLATASAQSAPVHQKPALTPSGGMADFARQHPLGRLPLERPASFPGTFAFFNTPNSIVLSLSMGAFVLTFDDVPSSISASVALDPVGALTTFLNKTGQVVGLSIPHPPRSLVFTSESGPWNFVSAKIPLVPEPMYPLFPATVATLFLLPPFVLAVGTVLVRRRRRSSRFQR